MRNITKTIITAVLLLLTVGLFAQEDSTKAIVKDANGISTGMTQKEFDQFKADYSAKAREMYQKEFKLPELKKEDDTQISRAVTRNFNNCINLNRIDEYKKFGVNLFRDPIEYDPEGKFVLEKVVVLGTVKSATYLDSAVDIPRGAIQSIRTLYNFEIDEIYKGKEKVAVNMDPNDKSIIIATQSSKKLWLSNSTPLKIGAKYLLFGNFAYRKKKKKKILETANNYHVLPFAGWEPYIDKIKANFKAITNLQEEDKLNFYKLNFKENK